MKVLFVDTVHPVLEEKLVGAGFSISHYAQKDRKEFLGLIAEYDGLVIRSKFILDQEAFDVATNLKFIARAGAGMENIDLDYAKNKGIQCFNSPEGNRDAVGEQAMGMLLMLLNSLKRVDSEVRDGIWKRAENRGYELMDKTIGLIGYGNTGSRFAKKLSGFDCEILVYDKYKTGINDSYVSAVSQEELLRRSGIISLHVPITEETKYLVDQAFIEQAGKPFYLINTSRGKNVNTKALVAGLKSGKVLGACLDVHEYESTSFEQMEQKPEAFEYLLKSDKVLLSPHIAGWTHESNKKMSLILAEKILKEFG